MNSNLQEKSPLVRRIRALAAHSVLILQMPAAWLRSLWAARELLDGRWIRTMGFRPKNALNSLFYRTQWLNIDRYGRTGRSPVVGLGDYPLSRWFHVSSLSHYVYANAGATIMLAGTIAWALAHLLWAEQLNPTWALLITVTLLLSTTAYAMAYVQQNYNILGWLWMPIALYAAFSGFWIIAALAWFLASLASITVIFVAVPLMAVHAMNTGQIEVVAVLFPAVVKIALHARPMLSDGGFRQALLVLGKLIGLVSTNVRYKRVSKRFDRLNTYLSILYLVGCMALWAIHGIIPWLPLTGSAIFIINQRFVRFADTQSVVMLSVTVFAATTLAMPSGFLQWLVLFVIANPLPYLFGLVDTDPANGSRRISVFTPFDHTRIESECDSMFEKVPAGNRILFAFDDPGGVYEKLFDGYRCAIEPVLYVAARRGIHLFPDWHAVAESNTDGDFYVWGRSLNEVRTNREHWQADFILCYLASDDALPDEWLNHYQVVGSFDYANHLEDLSQAVPWSGGLPCPKFLLLKPISV